MLQKLSFFHIPLLCLCIYKSTSQPSVIIVGAGSAGIAAAAQLLENSVTNIKIFEAEDRIGGRIKSVKFGDAYVDLGAEFCEGVKGNVVYELVEDFDLLNLDTSPSFYKNVYYSNGSKLDPNFTKEIELLLIEVDSYNKTDEDFDTRGKSQGDLFTHLYDLTLKKKYENEPDKLQLLKEGKRLAESFIITVGGSFSWFSRSIRKNCEYCEGNHFITWKGCGFKIILDILMKSYPDPNKKLPLDDKIFLNTKISKISWNETDTISVETENSTTYSADYVIFTPSIGVLKNQHHTLFHPQLPRPKREAIEAIGYEASVKVFLYFPVKWWNDDDNNFSFFWSEEDLKRIDFPKGPKKNGLSWVANLIEVTQVQNNPNVLLALFGGEFVPEIEKLREDTLKEGCSYVLEKFLGKTYDVTAIGQIIKSTWFSNTNFHGTNSYTKTGSYREDLSFQEILSEPLKSISGKPALLFAGEGTNPFHCSTVNAAIDTGYREAQRIIRLNKKLSKSEL